MLQEKHPEPFIALLNIIINDIDKQAAPFILVLDDFHNIHAKPKLEMIAYLLDYVPPQMHQVIPTRIDPQLPLSWLRVRNQLIEI